MAFKKLRANKNATKGKNKSWKKGQSSTYNPKIKKFREEAKKRVKFGVQGTNSKLTVKAIALHNEDNMDDITEDIDDCATSIGGLSFVSTFSNCTNPTFNRFLSRWHSNSAMHKEMLAVLAAVTEVIKAKGGNETETEYFAALMTTLDIVETDEARSAVFALLYIVIKRLPASVLKLHFTSTCNILQEQLIKYIDSDYNGLLKNLLGCLFFFLKSQEVSSWNTYVKEVYTVLLEFAVHHKPKVRKSAQEAVRYLLSMTPEESEQGVCHPAATMTGQFCVQKIEGAAGSEDSTTFHVLNLLKITLGKLPRSSLKLCCETVLRVMTLSNPIVVTTCLRCLQGLFTQNPLAENLPDELNVRIIKAMYDYQPNINDYESFTDWLLVMEYAFINLYRLNPTLCLNHLPRFYKVAVSAWLSERDSLHPVISATLKTVLHSCIVPSSPEFQQLMLDDPIDNPMHKIFHSVEDALSYKYHKAWKQVLHVLAAFFDVISKYSYPVMLKCLQSLANLRDGFKFPHITEVDKVIGNAIRRMGPETVFKAVPLKINLESIKMDFNRSWLLPLLRDNIQATEISYFVRYFLPMVAVLKKKVTECENDQRPIEAKTFNLVCLQIWALLPGFCNCPTDLLQSWKNIARVLGTTLNQQPELRMTILSSLRVLISKSMDKDDNRNEIAKFAKNFLPILFNLYTTETHNKSEEDTRLATFETIKVYLQITDHEMCQSFFQKAMEKLREASDFSQQALLDLTKSMLPYLNEEHISEIYEYCKPLLNSTQHTVQKKSYGVINELCSNQSKSCQAFISSHLKDLESLLLTSLSHSSPPSKALRLNCLKYIACQLTTENKDFILAVVPEATLCTKESASKARTAAYNLLLQIGNTLKKWKNDDGKGALREYLHMLLAGFTGSPHMMSATILAIGHVIYLFREDLDSDLIHLLIENICLLLTSRSREVVTSALSFIKVLFSTVSTTDLAQHVEHLVTCIAGISGDNQRAFRFKAKELLTRLVRKFGYEMIAKLAPEHFQKQLANIRKLENRKKKTDDNDSMDYELEKYPKKKSDLIDDVEYSDDETSHPQNVKRKSKTYIEEGENDIVDLLDPSANRRILASRPGSSKTVTEKSATEFEISSDGRLIITDEREDDSPRKMKKRKSEAGTTTSENSLKNKKRKLGDDDEEDDEIVVSKMKPVMKGIHRTLNKTPKFGAAFKSKKAAGDVKRGKIDPYAYVPLDRQALNKRKKKKLDGQFKGLFNAAKKGAQKGSKKRFAKGKKK